MYNVFKQVKRYFAIFSALCITVVSSKFRGHQGCAHHHLVQCTKPLSILTDSGLTFATSKDELDMMCPDMRDAVRCIHGYVRHCMTIEQRDHFKTLFHGTVMMVEDLCRNESYQREYLRHAPCMKNVEKQNEICLQNYTTTMNQIQSKTAREEADALTYQKRKRHLADESIRGVCCSFQQYVECSTHTMRRACGEEAAQFSKEFLDKMSSSLLRMHCQEYGKEQCGITSGGDNLSKLSMFVLLIVSTVASYVQ